MSKITAKTKMCIIIGDPVEHSLSPKMHNAAYEYLGIDDQFVFTAAKVDIKEIESVVKAVKVMGIRGLTCTIPHKMEVMKYLDFIDPIAQKIGAVNTVVNESGVLKGYNTDWIGTVKPLAISLGQNLENKFLTDKKVALIGAGGAARAMAFGVVEKGGNLKIFNRTIENAKNLASELNADYADLANLNELKTFDIIINSTSLGMGEEIDHTPVPAEFINSNQICFDAVYVPYETRFLKEAQTKGARIIHGIDMLLHQGTAQFEIYTDQKAPEDVMKESLFQHFGIKHG